MDASTREVICVVIVVCITLLFITEMVCIIAAVKLEKPSKMQTICHRATTPIALFNVVLCALCWAIAYEWI